MSAPRIVCLVAARMTSSRLPGKILKPILGRPALELMLERVRRTPGLAEVVVATTVNEADQPVVGLARKLGVGCFRGSEHDVLGRILQAARAHRADVIVELTSDCIAIDPAAVRKCVDAFLEGGVDYAGNVLERTYPVGMDTQIYPTSVLEEVDRLTRDPKDREHVSLYIYTHPEKYRLRNVTAPPAARWPELHLTLDTAADYAMLTALYEGLYPARPNFSTEDIVSFLKGRPDIVALNQAVPRNPSASEYFSAVKDRGEGKK